MTTVEILEAARDLIANPARWTQGDFARDEGGKGVGSLNADAVCWCAYGATTKVVGELWDAGEVDSLLTQAALQLFPEGDGAAWVNDRLGHEAVMRVYDRAIELASS